MSSALAGLRIIDFSRVLAGPLATMVLGDLGADVVKVEHPERGDDTRAWGPPYDDDGVATYYLGLNRNKRSIALDLKDPADLAEARRLCRTADVVVDNWRPGKDFGLDHDSLAAENPGVITCSITGFGSTGPGAHLGGYDFLVQAMSGLMSITGPAGGEPHKVGVALVDKSAGLYAAIAILAALHSRETSGEGQHIEVSLMASAMAGLLNVGSGYLSTGENPGRHGNRHPSIAPYQDFPTADDCIVVAVGTEKLWRRLCEVLERPDLEGDARFITNERRVANVDALDATLSETFATRPATEWIDLLRSAGIPAGPINDVAAAFASAEALGLDPVVDLDGFRSVRPPIRMSGTPPTVRRPPPDLDEHGEEIRA
ncbi:MAG: CoA transferase [Acidimicrobiia bacterium]|nr:CoA transferase [Acidimicrobiia bacterium]